VKHELATNNQNYWLLVRIFFVVKMDVAFMCFVVSQPLFYALL